jgi:co-chaperonin GroES (HSP10)
MRINNLPKRLLLTLWGVILGASLLSAQNKTVKGVVLDETDQGVIGAAVMIKGTTTGVATDIDGNFELNCAPSDVLVVTSIGYKDVEVTVGDTVLYGKYAGTEITFDGEKYLLLSQSDVLLIL